MKHALIFFLLISIHGLGQKNFTIEDAVLGSRDYLAPGRLAQLQFTKNEGELSFVEESSGEPVLFLVDKKGGRKKACGLQTLNKGLRNKGLVEISAFPMVKWTDASKFEFLHRGRNKIVFDVRSGKMQISSDVPNQLNFPIVAYSSGKTHTAYVDQHNVFLISDGVTTEVTRDGSNDIVYGQAVHRNEFGIEKGLFFSPKGNYLAFYRMDQSMVSDYPIIRWQKKPAQAEFIKYPFAGEKSHHVNIMVYDIRKKSTMLLQTEGDPEQYLTNICWSPDESKIYVAVVNRAQNHMKLESYDAVSGKHVKTLFEEHDEHYTEPMHPMIFVKNDPSRFIWQSNRDGYRHLYLYNSDGTLIRQLTSGSWEVKDLNGFDESGSVFYFHCNMSSPLHNDFCKVDLHEGKITPIATGNGTHTCTINEKGSYAVDHFSNSTTPRVLSLIDLKTGKSVEIFRAHDPISAYRKGTLRLFSIKNKENTDLYCRMFLPVDFDSTRKYPVLVYLYNGPHSQLVTNSWLGGADLWYHYMAQNGFIVFTLDGRGTDNRGKAFSQVIHRQLGTAEMEDQLAGVEWLKSRTYVDASRMGVHGWSYGGFMTISLMTRYPDVFKVGVAGGPVIDWSYYEIMYGERYMDSPQENPQGYAENNLLNHIAKLKGKLLVIHGTDDDVVVWQHSLMLLQQSVATGVQVDYNVYPGHPHNVRGKDRVHLMEKISRYFFENLK